VFRPAYHSTTADAEMRVLLVDDERLVRAGFRMILKTEPGIDIVGEASDGAEAIEQTRSLRPDVVLMDIRMPRMDGLEATRIILSGPAPRPRVVVLTTFDMDEYVYEALRSGASGFLLKDAPEDHLVAAIRVAADGGAMFAPSVTRRLVEEFVGRAQAAAPPREFTELTPRERQVLRLLAQGLSNHEIATRLFVSEHTAKSHVAHILQKLNLRDRVQAVVLAYETGLMTPGAPEAGRD
jgi:DNA-binding NarL/FixJ family response regulator